MCLWSYGWDETQVNLMIMRCLLYIVIAVSLFKISLPPWRRPDRITNKFLGEYLRRLFTNKTLRSKTISSRFSISYCSVRWLRDWGRSYTTVILWSWDCQEKYSDWFDCRSWMDCEDTSWELYFNIIQLYLPDSINK